MLLSTHPARSCIQFVYASRETLSGDYGLVFDKFLYKSSLLLVSSRFCADWLCFVRLEFGSVRFGDMAARKRGRGDFGLNDNGGFKKSKPEMDSLSSGIGSKLKPCTKFFSICGCPFGENCHFLHYVPGGYNSVAHMMNLPASRTAPGPVPTQNSTGVKTKLCKKYNTAEGCKFGDKCHYAHGDWELGKSMALDDTCAGRTEAAAVQGPTSSFGASATAKVSVDASLAGAIIGKGGVNSKQICRLTGVKLGVRDHESDAKLKNIELEGTFEQIQQASAMVRELIDNIGSSSSLSAPGGGGSYAAASNFKTKMCDNFSKGSCTFRGRCHFAHGAAELRKT